MARAKDGGLTAEQIREKADKAEGKKPPKSQKAIGRPPEYQASYAEEAARLCAAQASTDVDLADHFEVSIGTIYRWKTKYPEFSKALKVGKAESDDRVERSLYERAVGYTFDSEKIQVLRDGTVVRVPIREHVPPDTTAQIFWLKNRRPDLWRDVHKLEHGQPGEFDGLTADELRHKLTQEAAILGLSVNPKSDTAH